MLAVAMMLLTLNLSGYAFDHAEVDFGMSEAELVSITKATKVGDDGARGHSYTEFMEENPVVYVDSSDADKKLEYYFHDGKLYKVMKIYRDRVNDQGYYVEQVKVLEERFGEAKKIFSDQLFSMIILHHVWEDDETELDLRFGAGFVHEVRTHKKMRQDKTNRERYKYAI